MGAYEKKGDEKGGVIKTGYEERGEKQWEQEGKEKAPYPKPQTLVLLGTWTRKKASKMSLITLTLLVWSARQGGERTAAPALARLSALRSS
ncbi:hypothetical protein Q5P01_007740 [Channa striata]|uniref:Uncharacterized protein n=1 Tax=Channa striata TaxID=64152 RepID=A0AA88N8U3_CHASR|nr:hypothetical protein Q5P01_007740 [Channa striata]